MNIYANPNSAFPSQTVSDIEKSSEEYGRQVAQAIEGEWWQQGGNGTRFATCLLYTSPSPRDLSTSRMPSSA